MNGARRVAGQKSHAGTRAPEVAWSKADSDRLRTAFHHFSREHKRRVRKPAKPRWGRHKQSKHVRRERLRPRSWCAAFLLAMARVGELKQAARLAGVPVGTVRNYISRETYFRAAVKLALGEHVFERLKRISERSRRQLERGRAIGRRDRCELWPKEIRALVRYCEGRFATELSP